MHEDIRKWADTDRTAGGDGLQRLRRAYMKDVKAGQLGRDSMGFQEWLESKGFDPYNEMGYRGNRKILNEIAPMDTIESGDPDQAHRARLRRDRVVNSYLQKYGDESLAGDCRRRAEAIYDDAAARTRERGESSTGSRPCIKGCERNLAVRQRRTATCQLHDEIQRIRKNNRHKGLVYLLA